MGGCLPASSNDTYGHIPGVSQVFYGDASGRAGAQLAQPVGLSVEKQLSGVGVIEANLEGVGAFDHCVGLDPQQVHMEKTTAHNG